MEMIFRLEGIDCGVCAGKIESKIKKLKGVSDTNFNLIMEKLVVSFEKEPTEELISEINKICKKVEPNCSLSEF